MTQWSIVCLDAINKVRTERVRGDRVEIKDGALIVVRGLDTVVRVCAPRTWHGCTLVEDEQEETT